MRVKLVVLLAMVVAPAVVLVTVVASDICKVMSPVAFPTEGDEVRPVKRGKFGYAPQRCKDDPDDVSITAF